MKPGTENRVPQIEPSSLVARGVPTYTSHAVHVAAERSSLLMVNVVEAVANPDGIQCSFSGKDKETWYYWVEPLMLHERRWYAGGSDTAHVSALRIVSGGY